VWTISKKNEHKQLTNTKPEESDGEQITDRICLLHCLTGHTGNIHTVAFSRAEMLVIHTRDIFTCKKVSSFVLAH